MVFLNKSNEKRLMTNKIISEVLVLLIIDMKSPKNIDKAIMTCLKVDQEVWKKLSLSIDWIEITILLAILGLEWPLKPRVNSTKQQTISIKSQANITTITWHFILTLTTIFQFCQHNQSISRNLVFKPKFTTSLAFRTILSKDLYRRITQINIFWLFSTTLVKIWR